MSVLSAAGLLTPTEAQAYGAALLDLVGSSDPLAILAATPRKLRDAIDEFPKTALWLKEAPDKWSAAMLVAHLADSELVGAFRLRMILAHDRPVLTPYDQDRWATSLGYQHADPDECWNRFFMLRRVNLAIWSQATPFQLARTGRHEERGDESVDRMRRLYAGHDLTHLRQLERIRLAVTRQ